MGMFDDLVPQYAANNSPQTSMPSNSSGGMFSDLIPGSVSQQSRPDTGLGTQLGLTARYGIEGGLALPNMAANALGSVINTALPDGYKLGSSSDATSQLLTKIGLPQPQGTQQNIVGDMSRAVAGLGTSMGLGANIPQLSVLTQNPIMQARAAMGSSGASGLMREAGGGAIPQALAGLAGGYGATRTPFTETPPTPKLSQSLKDDAQVSYQDAADSGASLSPEFTNKFLDEAATVPKQTEAGIATEGTNEVTNLLKRWESLKDKPLSLNALQEMDQALGSKINTNLNPKGGLNEVGKGLFDLQSKLRDSIENAAPEHMTGGQEGFDALQNGRKLWSQAARARDLEQIMTRADLSDNPATVLRSGFRTLYTSPNRMNGFSPEQQDLIRRAATVSMPVEMLRGLGSRLIGVIAAGTGNVGKSILTQGATAIPRDLATQMQMNRAQSVLDSIAKPNPLMMPLPASANQIGTIQGLVPFQYGAQQ